MRILMLFTLGFSAACGLCGYCLWNIQALWLEIALGFLFLSVSCFLFRKRKAVIAGICLLGLCVGFLWCTGYDFFRVSGPRKLDGKTERVVITVSDYGAVLENGSRAEGAFSLDGKSYQVCFYTHSTDELEPGDRVEGEFFFRFTAPGGAREQTHYAGEGVLLLAYPQGEVHLEKGNFDPLAHIPAKLRRRMLTTLEKTFSPDVSPFATAILLGEDSSLSYSQNTALKVSGIRHVIAVSGLHVAIIMAGICLLTARRRWLTLLAGLPVLALFAAVAGFTPSVVRACIMQAVFLFGVTSRREYDPPTSLSFAALLLLAWNPLAVTSVSFQLSIASIAGILMLSSRIYERLRGLKWFAGVKPRSLHGKLLHWILGTVSVSLGAMSLTVPLSAVYFGTVSIIGIVTNLLTLWVISFIFYGVFFVCVLGLFSLSLASAAAWVVAWPIRYVLAVANLLSKVPMGCLYMSEPLNVYWLVFAYAVLAVVFLHPRARLYQGICTIALGLAMVTACNWMVSGLEQFRVTVLDVGQGQCILLESRGKVYMVDCGGEYEQGVADLAAETLLARGIFRLDGLILTHYDSDHSGAAEYLLSRLPADVLFLPEDMEDPLYETLTENHSGSVFVVSEDLFLNWDNAKLSVFASNGGKTNNEKSLCVLFQCENYDILITGDRTMTTEVGLLLHAGLPELDALVAGHHGAATAAGMSLLQETKPKTVLISVGADNGYGHPDQETLQRLEEFGCEILRTDLDGTIIIRG